MDDSIRLRLMTPEDTENIIKWRNNENVRKNFIYQGLFTKESHEKWIETKIKTGEVVQMIIEETDGGRAIGSVYIRDIDHSNHKGEYGIFIGEDDTRGKGYGTKAAKQMIHYAFETLHLHRLFLRVYADNEQAIRSYEKAGFVREAYLKDDVFVRGCYRDIILMAIIDNEIEKEETK